VKQVKGVKVYKVTEKLHIFPTEAAWTYVPIPLSKVPDVPRGGWGRIPVNVTVGKTTWRTSIFPMRKDNYFVPIKRLVRDKEGLFVGEAVKLTYSVA